MSSISRPSSSVARINVTPVSRIFGGPELTDFRRGMDEMLGRWLGDNPFTQFQPDAGAFQPAVDIWETPEAYVLNATLPGVSKDDLELEVTGDTLSIKGERKPREDDKNIVYHVRNIGYGQFHIAYTLPVHIDASAVKAEFRDGILEVTLPKMETAKTRTIKVNVNKGE